MHNKEFEAVCECGEGQYDKIVVPVKLEGVHGPEGLTIECPQCGDDVPVTRRES